MQSSTALRDWLATRSTGRLAELLRERQVSAASGYGARGPANPAELADHLLTGSSVGLALQRLELRELQVLVAVVQLADRRYGPAHPAGAADPAERAVPRSPTERSPPSGALRALLHAGADRYFPAVPGAGPRLHGHPELAEAVRHLSDALEDLLPPPRTTARFQADLTAVVTGAASPELTELLSACATRESEGHAVVWRITAASVRRALDSGLDAADLLRRLTDASADGLPLPQPLEYLVKDTARTHGRMRVVRSACCVRSDDEALVLELSKARALAKLGLRRIAPTVLVSTAEPDAVLTALRAAGYAPVLEAASGTTVVERAAQVRAPRSMPSLSDAERHLGTHTAAALAARLLGGSGRR